MAHYERAPRHVVAARYAGDYQVWLQFNDGRKGLVDLADELYGAIFEPLRNRVTVRCGRAALREDGPAAQYGQLERVHDDDSLDTANQLNLFD